MVRVEVTTIIFNSGFLYKTSAENIPKYTRIYQNTLEYTQNTPECILANPSQNYNIGSGDGGWGRRVGGGCRGER